MPRKPLIDEDILLGGGGAATPADLNRRILARSAAARPPAPTPDDTTESITSNITSLEDAKQESKQDLNEASKEASKEAHLPNSSLPEDVIPTEDEAPNTDGEIPEERAAAASLTKQVTPKNAGMQQTESEREIRLRKALAIAENGEWNVATLRVSTKLEAYLEKYVARMKRINPKARYRKQDAFNDALAAFYADHPLPELPADNDELE